ncbi:MAG: tRNA A-37 threonylcarbamoyl transferase component Bud32 [Planctomycetota bacterium]|jgi:tRNA A-37 threonylcarbamoyl transferase component Bud32
MSADNENADEISESRVLSDDEESLFGFDSTDDDWVKLAHESEAQDQMGGIGSYELIEEIDRGGQGVVYRARQPGTGRDIALKRLIAGSFSSRSSRERFQREIEAVSSLSHPCIVTIHGYEVVDGLPLMAMEWIDGVPITHWANPKGGPQRTVRQVINVFLDLCAAVSHAHQNGVLHRDLKPSNVLVTADARPHVLDFGLAKSLAADGDVTVSREFAGTPAYASPEQFNTERLDVRSDVYSLGVLLYEMLTGKRPYRPEDGIRQFFEALERGDNARPSKLRPKLSREIDWVCARALAPNRLERYQGVDALADDLRRHLAGEPVLAHPTSAVYQLRKLIARNRRASALTGLLFLTILAAGLFYRHSAAELALRAEDVTLARDAEALTRARAESARDAEIVAREQAEEARDAEALARLQAEEARDAESAALAELENQFKTVRLAQRRGNTILNYLRDDVLLSDTPLLGGPDTTIRTALSHAAARLPERFKKSPVIGAYVQRNLGFIQWRIGLYEDAENTLRNALETAVAENADLSEASACTYLGGLLCDRGRLQEAEDLLVYSKAILDRHSDRLPDAYWDTLHQLIHLYLEIGNLEACALALDEILLLSTTDLSEEPLRYCNALIDQGRLQLAEGEYQTAVQTLELARELYGKISNSTDADYGVLLHTLAEAKLMLGEEGEALLLGQLALTTCRESIVRGHPRIGEVLGLLAHLTRDDASQFDLSQSYAREAMFIAAAEGEPDTPTRARTRKRLIDYPFAK